MPPSEQHEMQAGPFAIVNGKKVDAFFHEDMLNNPEAEDRADLGAIRQAVKRGMPLDQAIEAMASPRLKARLAKH